MTTTILNEIGNDANATTSNNISTAQKGSAFEIGYLGDLGVKGLTVQAFYTNGDRINGQNAGDKDVSTRNLGISYNTGALTLSANHIVTEGLQAGWSRVTAVPANAELAEELKGKSVGLAYAASKDLSFGLTYAKADSSHVTSTETEKTVIASVGYSLGAVGLKASYADVTDFAGVANNDGKMVRVLAFTSF